MDIKATRKIIVGANQVPVKVGDIARNVDDAEAKALIAQGYAVEATARDTKAKGDAPSNKSAGDPNAALRAVLEGTVADITGKLDTYSAEELIALRDLETAGANRKGVIDAISQYDLGDGQE